MLDKTISLKFIGNLESALADHPNVFSKLQTLFHLPQDIQNQDRMKVVKFIHLLQVIEQDYGITDIGYRLGQHYTPAQMGILGLYLQTCNTLNEAIHHYLEYSYLDAEFEMPLALTMNDNHFSIKLTPPNELLDAQDTYTVIRANRIIKAIQYFCAPDVIPLFISANLSDKGIKFHDTIEVVHTPNHTISLTYSNQVLDRRLPGRNATLNKYFKQEIEKLISESCRSQDLVSTIIYQLTTCEHLAQMSLGTLADLLAMSERTLSRKLKNIGVQLKDMLTHAKKHHAIRNLSSGMNISEVAHSLGFSDRSSFERAFKTWTGFTPAKFKEFNQIIPQLAQQNSLTHTDSLAAISNIQSNIEQLILTPATIDQAELASTIGQDPILTAKIYGLSQLTHYSAYETSSINQALDSLYHSHITRGMCHAIINNSFVTRYHFPGIKLDEHWQDAFLMAEFSRLVVATGEFENGWSESEIYLLGNTCYIGFIFLLKSDQENMTKMFENYNLSEFQSLTFSQAIEQQCEVSAFMAAALIMTHWGYPLKYIKVLINLACDTPTKETENIVNLLRCADEVSYAITKNNEAMATKAIERLTRSSQLSSSILQKVYEEVKQRYLKISG